MKMKKLFLLLTVALLGQWAIAQNRIDYSVYEDKLNLYVANDLGRNGYYDQKPIAELMGEMAEEVGPECVIAAGDVHHFEGVRSVPRLHAGRARLCPRQPSLGDARPLLHQDLQ